MSEQPQPPAGPAGSAIALTAKYAWMTFILGLFKPFLAINGHRVPIGWGRTVVPVPPGQYHVHVHVPYLIPSRIGTAETVVPVYPGQVVEVEYRAPAIGWLSGSIGPAPQQHRGMAASIALMVGSLLLVCCVTGLLGFAVLSDSGTRDDPYTLPTFTPYSAPARPSTPAPDTASPSAAGTEPTLRSTPARTLVGPSYAAGADTFTMALDGYPFAFRVPPTWGCLPGKISIPDAKAWVCIDEGNPFDSNAPQPDRTQRLQIMLRPCAAPCAQSDRDQLSKEWFNVTTKAKTVDGYTSYIETPRDNRGRYTLDMSHFTPADGTPAWQVGVGAYSAPETKAVIQKIFNDILTQAG
ncbi:hypothetical protein [Actinoplanes sp. NPDC051494]|uniref:hypothetical protein n=1 Tax=Actinoplanes sp. NPDC051494 TaxID=3363907 RepID=UPI003796020A